MASKKPAKKKPAAKAAKKKPAKPAAAKGTIAAAKAAKKPATKGAKKKPAKGTIAAAKLKAAAAGPKLDGAPEWLVEAFGPTLRVYAEEEAHVLALASRHPKLGERFVREVAARTTGRVSKRDLPAFLEEMAKVDVEARVNTVVRKLEKAWGAKMDDETREGVREDVLEMYLGG